MSAPNAASGVLTIPVETGEDLTVDVAERHDERICLQDSRVATHLLVFPSPCPADHPQCLHCAETAVVVLCSMQSALGRRVVNWECTEHHVRFRAAVPDLRVIPLRWAQ